MENIETVSEKIKKYHEQAAAVADFDDFGDPGDGYLDGLRFFLDSIAKEADLTDLGKTTLDQTVVGNLVSRLFAQRGLAEYPECLDQPIVKPIIVVGLGRSGTTALHKILSSAPGSQSLEYWLGMFPMPRPPRETWPQLKLYQEVDKALAEFNRRVPEFIAVHPYVADLPDECNRIIGHSFMTWAHRAVIYAPSYGEWVLRQHRPKVFERYRKVLQLIGHQNPARWVLKDPLHLPYIDLVLEQFPDACVVHISREPSESMPSVCNGIYMYGAPYLKNMDKREYGRRTAENEGFMMDRFMELRGQLNPDQFLDVRYTDLITEPVELAKRVYAHFGIDVADGGACFEQWYAGNKRGKYGEHRYTSEDYGLSTEGLNKRFARYREMYLGSA